MPTIRAVDVTPIAVPLERPVRSVVRCDDHLIAVLVRLHLDGVEGTAFVSAFTPHIARAISALVEQIASHIVDLDFDVETVEAVGRRALRLIGTSGPAASAIAALDLAAWDLAGKLAAVPVHRLLGSTRTEVDVYASDGCWLVPVAQVADEAAGFVEGGFRGIKVRVGRPRLPDDLVVLRTVRSVIGPDVELMVDANQGWDVGTALRVLPELASIGVHWLEEPIRAEDFEGYATLSRGSTVGLVAGESLFSTADLTELTSSAAIAVLTPDLQRIGGISGWRRSIEVARKHADRVTPHLYPEFSVHVLAAEPNPGPLEWVGWHGPLFHDGPTPIGGRMVVPDAPGFGLVYDWEAIDRFALKATVSSGGA